MNVKSMPEIHTSGEVGKIVLHSLLRIKSKII